MFFFSLFAALFGKVKLFPVILWLAPPFIILNYLASVPGTHIYNYVIPLMILGGYGVVSLWQKLSSIISKTFYLSFILILFGFLFYQSYTLFVDHSVEYPWWDKKVLFWRVGLPSNHYHLSIFGFPYKRNLGEINKLVRKYNNIDKVSSNENSKILRYYVKPLPYIYPKYDVYIYIYGAQSLLKTKSAKVNGLEPTATYFRGNHILAEVYLVEHPPL